MAMFVLHSFGWPFCWNCLQNCLVLVLPGAAAGGWQATVSFCHHGTVPYMQLLSQLAHTLGAACFVCGFNILA